MDNTFEVSCQCAGKPYSPGQNGCMPQAGRDKFPIFVYLTGSDGTANKITAGTTLNQAWITAKANAVDKRDAYYVLPEMYGLAEPPAENETEDIDNVPHPTGEETKQPWTWEHAKDDYNPALKAVYDSLKCQKIGVFFVTIDGCVSGINDGYGNLLPIPLEGKSLFATPSRAVKGTTAKLMVSMLEDELVNGANYDFIDAADIEFDARSWFAVMPIECIFTEVSQSGQDTIVFNVNSLYGGVDFKSPVTGLETADIAAVDGTESGNVYNETDLLYAPGTLTESATIPGQYTFVFNDYQHDGDICFMQIFKEGYRSAKGFRFTIATS